MRGCDDALGFDLYCDARHICFNETILLLSEQNVIHSVHFECFKDIQNHTEYLSISSFSTWTLVLVWVIN